MAHFIKDADDYWDRFPPGLEGLRTLAELSQLRASLHVLGQADDDTAPVAVIVRIPPNTPLPRHAHVAHRLEVLIEGSLLEDGVEYHPGDVMTAGTREFYGPMAAGPDGATTVEIFSARTGAHQVLYEMGDGNVTQVDTREPAAAAALMADFKARTVQP